jgi:hypothetical protein
MHARNDTREMEQHVAMRKYSGIQQQPWQDEDDGDREEVRACIAFSSTAHWTRPLWKAAEGRRC